MNWPATEACESPDCPHRIAVNNLAGLAAGALAETGLERAMAAGGGDSAI